KAATACSISRHFNGKAGDARKYRRKAGKRPGRRVSLADPGETAKRDRERAPQAEKRRYHRSPAGARRGIGGNAPRFSARRGRNEDPRPRAPQQQRRQRQAIDARRRGAPLKKD